MSKLRPIHALLLLVILQVLGVLPTVYPESWKPSSFKNREVQAEDPLAEEYLDAMEEFYGVSPEEIDPGYATAMEEFYGENYVDVTLDDLEYQLFMEDFYGSLEIDEFINFSSEYLESMAGFYDWLD